MFNNQLDTHEHQPCRVAITLRMRTTVWSNSGMHGCADTCGDGQTVACFLLYIVLLGSSSSYWNAGSPHLLDADL